LEIDAVNIQPLFVQILRFASHHCFTEGKAFEIFCSGMQCVKLSFTNKKFVKWRRVIISNFFHLALKKYGIWFLTPWEPVYSVFVLGFRP